LSVLLDTHIWVWWLTPGSPLSRAERDALDAIAGRRELFLPAISLWEVQVLHAKRRFKPPLPFAEWLARAADDRVISVLPLGAEVIFALDALPASFHGDPADRLIVATARAHAMLLATHDAAIRRSRAVKIWKP
jgi:PIN domain nuclease of toxin-antitoxin system